MCGVRVEMIGLGNGIGFTRILGRNPQYIFEIKSFAVYNRKSGCIMC